MAPLIFETSLHVGAFVKNNLKLCSRFVEC
jgi:hypothetical protein